VIRLLPRSWPPGGEQGDVPIHPDDDAGAAAAAGLFECKDCDHQVKPNPVDGRSVGAETTSSMGASAGLC
jgi:hypothetical protein